MKMMAEDEFTNVDSMSKIMDLKLMHIVNLIEKRLQRWLLLS